MTNEAGTVVEQTDYLPFGETRSHSGTEVSNYKFTDKELDPESGLYNYDARMYDPVIGLFVTADIMVQNFSNPQTLNRYAYCGNNPLAYVDPSGHLFGIDDAVIIAVLTQAAIGAVIGATLGAGISAIMGGDIAMGALTGAVTGAFMGGVGGYGNAAEVSATTQVCLHVAAGAVSGSINAAITGGNIGMGALTGGISAGLAEWGGGMLFDDGGLLADSLEPGSNMEFAAQLAGTSVIGGIAGGITSTMYGEDFMQGFSSGAMTSAIGYLANEAQDKVIKEARGRVTMYNTGDTTCIGEDFDTEKETGATRIEYMKKEVIAKGVYAKVSAEGYKPYTVRINDRISAGDPKDVVLDLSPAAMKAFTGKSYNRVWDANVTYFRRW